MKFKCKCKSQLFYTSADKGFHQCVRCHRVYDNSANLIKFTWDLDQAKPLEVDT
jgi:hypothetical protein